MQQVTEGVVVIYTVLLMLFSQAKRLHEVIKTAMVAPYLLMLFSCAKCMQQVTERVVVIYTVLFMLFSQAKRLHQVIKTAIVAP